MPYAYLCLIVPFWYASAAYYILQNNDLFYVFNYLYTTPQACSFNILIVFK